MRSQLTSGYYKYTDADNHTVYAYMNTAVPGSASFNKQTSRENVVSRSWTSFRTRPSATLYPVVRGTVTAEAVFFTCLDIPARPDVCSKASKSVTARV